MNNILRLALLMGLFVNTLQAQEENRMAIQTNLLSLLRPSMPAANIGLTLEDEMKFYTIEMDVGFRVNSSFTMTPEEVRLNGFTSNHRFGVSPDITGGIHWYFNERKRSFHGLRANVGYFMFNHEQTICEESESRNGVCVCQSVRDNEFSTAHLRVGIHYRLGVIRPFKSGNSLELSFDFGLFGFLRQNLDRVEDHNMCRSVSVRDPRATNFLGDLFRNRMFNFDRSGQGYMRMNLVYRFML